MVEVCFVFYVLYVLLGIQIVQSDLDGQHILTLQLISCMPLLCNLDGTVNEALCGVLIYVSLTFGLILKTVQWMVYCMAEV